MYTNINEYIAENKKGIVISDSQPDILLDLLHLPKLVLHKDVLKDMNNFLGYNIKVYEALLEKTVDESGEIEFYPPMYILYLPFENSDKDIGYILDSTIFIKTEIVDNVFSKYYYLDMLSAYKQ